jgi:hypothetical protein
VRVLPEAEALAAAAAAQKQSEAATNELSSLADQLASRRTSLRREQEQIAAEVEDMKARRDFSGAYSAKVAAIGAIEDELASLDELKSTGDDMRTNPDQRTSSRQFAEALLTAAKPSGVTRTNADGEFSIEIPKGQGRVALLIEASRELETVERFVWFLWLDQLAADSGVHLFSNHNVLESGSSANVINVSAAPAN